MATSIVDKSGGQYHVLLIIADGQVLIQFKRNLFCQLQNQVPMLRRKLEFSPYDSIFSPRLEIHDFIIKHHK